MAVEASFVRSLSAITSLILFVSNLKIKKFYINFSKRYLIFDLLEMLRLPFQAMGSCKYVSSCYQTSSAIEYTLFAHTNQPRIFKNTGFVSTYDSCLSTDPAN